MLYLIPYLFVLYLLAYLDRVNVAVAALGMAKPPAEHGLGFDARILGFGAGVFFWGYWILEMPSTLSVLRWGARSVFVRILVLWGLSCLLLGFIGLPWMDRLLGWLPAVNRWPLGGWLLDRIPHRPDEPTVAHFYFLRFLLGLFEGGFFPSVILYLSLWFRPRDRGRAIATFMAAIPVSSLLGAPLSGALLQLDWLGLPGWRWVFILQGAAPLLAGFVTLFFLPNRPEDAAWLQADEKSWLVQELAGAQQPRTVHGPLGWLSQAWVVLLMTGYYFCMNVTGYGLSMFMPSILKAQASVSDSGAALLAGLPYLAGLAGSWHGQTESSVCMAVRIVSKHIPVLERDESPASGSARRNRSSSFPTRRFTDARGSLATGTTSS
jgi:ACS family tartrate transporter-like MFS transporter